MRAAIVGVLLVAVLLAPHRATADSEWRTWERYMETGEAALNGNRVLGAESWFSMAVREAERIDPRDPRLGDSLRKLLEMYRRQGRADDARKVEARLATVAAPSTAANDLADTLKAFASLLRESGRPVEAREVGRTAEDVVQRKDARNAVTHVRTYAAMLRAQHRDADAQRVDAVTAVAAEDLARRYARLRRALASQTALPSVTHVRLLEIADEAFHARLFPEAEAFAADAVKIARTFPNADVTLAYSVSVLASALAAQGRRAEFDEAVGRAMPVLERPGVDHGLVLPALRILAIAHVEHDFDPARAQQHLRRALPAVQRLVGPDHPTIGLHLAGLAAATLALEGPARATPDAERALAIAEKLYGSDQVYLPHAFTRLVTVAADRRDYALAHSVASRVVAVFTRMLGPGHPDVVLATDRVRLIADAQKPPAR